MNDNMKDDVCALLLLICLAALLYVAASAAVEYILSSNWVIDGGIW